MATVQARRVAAALLVVLVITGCGAPTRWETRRVEILWAERQVLYALSSAQGRIDAYSLRGGVAWLGGMDLPAGECFHTQQLDPASGRLWLWSDRGGMLVDARRLSAVVRWKGPVAVERPPADVVTAHLEPVVCAGAVAANPARPVAG